MTWGSARLGTPQWLRQSSTPPHVQSTLDTFPRQSGLPTTSPTSHPKTSPRTTALQQGSLASLFQALASAEGSLTPAVLSLARSCGLRQPRDLAFYSWKTSKGLSDTITAVPLAQSSEHWMRSGMMRSGKCLTAKSSCRRTAPTSSFSEYLEDPSQVGDKYFLSAQALNSLLNHAARHAARGNNFGVRIHVDALTQAMQKDTARAST